MSWRVAITIELRGKEYDCIPEYIKSAGFEPVYRPNFSGDPYAIIDLLRDCDAVLAGGDRFDKRVLEALAGKLRIISRFGIGYDAVDVETATKLGIAVTNTPMLMAPAVAEMTLGLLLTVSRHIAEFDRSLRSGKWKTTYVGTQLEGKTVGLIGFGNIPQCLAKYLLGFDCRILSYDILFNQDVAAKYNVQFATLDEIASESDIVSVHLPLTGSTRNIIAAPFFSKMKSGAILVNTGRGGVVNEHDLIIALEQKVIYGAGLDVFDMEPIPADNPLLKMDNVVLTPHISSQTRECLKSVGKLATDNIIDTFENKMPRNILNPDYRLFMEAL